MDDVTIIRPSAKYVVLRVVLTLFAVETAYALLFLSYLWYRPAQHFDRAFIISLWVLHTVKFLILVTLLSEIIIRFLSTHYFITKHHLVISKGLVSDEEKLYELQQVRKISVYQDGMGKRMNYGSINLLMGARGYEERLTIVNVANPHHVVKVIEKYLGTSEGPQTPR